MKLYALPTLAAALILFSGNTPTLGQTDDDLEAEWKLACTCDGKQTYPGCDQSRMILGPGGRIVFELAGKVTNRGDLTCFGSGKLRRIDLHLEGGGILLGVYELKGDELVICFAEAGRDRPTTTTPKASQWAETWKRVKP